MPNWMLSENHQTDFKAAVNTLVMKQVHLVEFSMPLTVDQIQEATAPVEVRDMLRKLGQLGIETVTKTAAISCVLPAGFGIRRDTLVRLYVPNAAQIYYCYEGQSSQWQAQHAFTARKYDRIPFDLDALGEEVRGRFIDWVNKSVQERRRAKLTNDVVKSFLTLISERQEDRNSVNYVVSMAKALARWPAMRIVFKHMAQGRGAFGNEGADWGKRVDEAPRSLKRWTWPSWGKDADWHTANKLSMRVAEEMLINAATLPAIDHNKRPTGEIQEWRALEGEKL